jgi:hypothetical protein
LPARSGSSRPRCARFCRRRGQSPRRYVLRAMRRRRGRTARRARRAVAEDGDATESFAPPLRRQAVGRSTASDRQRIVFVLCGRTATSVKQPPSSAPRGTVRTRLFHAGASCAKRWSRRWRLRSRRHLSRSPRLRRRRRARHPDAPARA